MVVKTDVKFEEAYSAWLAKQAKGRQGEGKRKLANGVEHAQKMFLSMVWWPLFGHFHALTPEFETRDFKDGFRYLDFVWILGSIRIAIEIDGFGPHWRNIDRYQFSDHLNRQNHLMLDDWIVLRFSYDMIKDHPRSCQQLILQAMGKWGPNKSASASDVAHPIDRVILTYAKRSSIPFSPTKAAEDLGWHRITVNRRILALVREGLLVPASNGKIRSRKYILNENSPSASRYT